MLFCFVVAKTTRLSGQTPELDWAVLQKRIEAVGENTEASLIGSLTISKQKKLHSIVETLIKPVFIEVLLLQRGNNHAEIIKTMPLSNDKVKRRIDCTAGDCAEQ